MQWNRTSMTFVVAAASLIAMPARSLAEWFRDFNDGTTQGLIEYDVTHIVFGIDEFAPSIVDNAIRMQFNGLHGNDDSAIMYDPEIFGDTSARVLIRFSRYPSFYEQWELEEVNGGFVIRFDLQSISGYACLINDGGRLQIIRVDAGAPTPLCQVELFPDFDPSLDWWLRAECEADGQGGLDLRARAWADAGPEPNFWHVACADPNPHDPGVVGLLANEDEDGNGASIDLDEVSVTLPPFEICDNGIDDDNNGLIDCADIGCEEFTACVCSDPFADADGDGDVDQSDFARMQSCLTGADDPAGAYDPARCGCFDRDDQDGMPPFDRYIDGDGDVDGDDLATFEACAGGPAIPADPACDD